MEDFFSKLFYPEGDDRGARLDDALRRIQEKYKPWFDENIGQDEDPEKRDILYYRTMYITPDFIKFKIDIPNLHQVIENECNEVFNEIYG